MRNTSNEAGISPAKMVFGQELRSILPSIASQLIKERRTNYYNERSHNLDALAINDKVRIQDDEKSVGTTKRWTRTGVIVKVGAHRQYQVELTNGYKIWRNRRFLRKAYQAEKESNGARITFAKEMPKRHRDTQEEELREIPARRENTERIPKSRNRARVDYRKLAGLDFVLLASPVGDFEVVLATRLRSCSFLRAQTKPRQISFEQAEYCNYGGMLQALALRNNTVLVATAWCQSNQGACNTLP